MTRRAIAPHREVTAALSAPLSLARVKYLRRVLTPITSELIIGTSTVRASCASVRAASVAEILGCVCSAPRPCEPVRAVLRPRSQPAFVDYVERAWMTLRREPYLSDAELARSLAVSTASATRIVEHLVAQGRVVRDEVCA